MQNKAHILISVQKRFTDGFLSGEKTVELRRKPLRISSGTQVWIYSKSPRAKIELVATAEGVEEGPTKGIWRKYGHSAAISKEEFDAYYAGADKAYAILLRDFRCLRRSLALDDAREALEGFHPPQFFRFLRHGSPELKLLQSHLGH